VNESAARAAALAALVPVAGRRVLIAVTGGRGYRDREHVFVVLDAVRADLRAGAAATDVRLIHGGANGADKSGSAWATRRQVQQTTLRPDWSTYGKAAGSIRNGQILDACPFCVVAFPGGTGTGDMIRRTIKARIEIRLAGEHAAELAGLAVRKHDLWLTIPAGPEQGMLFQD